jgi:carboxymethylenebutenolidase
VLIARNDAERMPNEEATLKSALAAVHRTSRVEVYPANHGWCVAGSQTYDEKQAERAWAELLPFYRASLG